MRCLCSIHIFREINDGVFANNAISGGLVDNEPLRAYIAMLYVALHTPCCSGGANAV